MGYFLELKGALASTFAVAFSTLGILAIAAFGSVAERYSTYFSAFAVGLLTVGVFFHLMPEAIVATDDAYAWMAGGFTIMVLIGIAVQLTVKDTPEGAALTFGYASIIALASHSFLDGVIYAAAFEGEPFTGWLTVSGLILHEVPEGVIAYVLLAQAGIPKLRSALLAFLAASLTTYGGMLIANMVSEPLIEQSEPALLAAAAGALVYVLIVHLGPHAANAPKNRGYLFAQFGVIVGVATIVIETLSHTGHAH